MSDAVIVALVSGVLTLAGVIISNMLTHSKTIYRIDLLEKKVDKHNNLVERMYIVENKVENIEAIIRKM